MTDADISLHEEYMQAAFQSVLDAEQALVSVEGSLSQAIALLKTKKALAEGKLVAAWKSVKELMDETGEAEVLLPGGNGTYNKVYYTTPRQRVVVDEDAIPDEFCKIERKPRLKDIGEHLDSGAKINWARYELGESRLAWKNVKTKGNQNE